MSTKRKYTEEDDIIHPSRQAQIPSSHPTAAKKPRKFDTAPKPYKKQAHASSVNLVKKKIRDVTRRMERSEELPADVKAEDERALAAYKQELTEAENEKVRQAMIKRYHMVRFFERQKATRLLKRLRKALIATTDESEVARLSRELHTADVDLNYTQYSPLNEVYISIYPQNAAEDDHKDESKKPEMWREVEKRMEDGGLEQLRNGVRTTLVSRPKSFKPKVSGANGEVQAKTKQVTKATWSGSSDTGGALVSAPAPPKHISKRMTDDEFFKLNRRQKRQELRRSGALPPASAPSKKQPQSKSAKDEDDSGNISDGGFFEEE